MVGTLNRKLLGWSNYFCLVLSAKPTGWWINIPPDGYASGCAPNIKLRAREPDGSLTLRFTCNLACSGLPSGPAVLRGRKREASSESRMR